MRICALSYSFLLIGLIPKSTHPWPLQGGKPEKIDMIRILHSPKGRRSIVYGLMSHFRTPGGRE